MLRIFVSILTFKNSYFQNLVKTEKSQEFIKIYNAQYFVLSCSVVSDSWTLDHLAPQSMGFPRQEYWSGLPFTSLRDLPDPGIKPMSLASLALAGGFFTTEPPGKPKYCTLHRLKIGCSKIQSPSPSLSEGKYS